MTAPSHVQITRQALVNADTRTRLTIFAQQFLDSFYSIQTPKLVAMGSYETTEALIYKFPIAVGMSRWTQTLNGIKYRDVGELIGTVNINDWSDGARIEYKKLQSDEWASYGWGKQPQIMASVGKMVPERLIVSAIETGDTTYSVENNFDTSSPASSSTYVFAQGKQVDPMGRYSGIYSNKFTSTGTASLNYADAAAPLTLANIDRVYQTILTTLSENAKDYRNLRWTKVLVHPFDYLRACRYFHDLGPVNDQISDIYPYTDANQINTTNAAGAKAFPVPNSAKKMGIEVVTSPYMSSSRSGIWYPICEEEGFTEAPWLTIEQIPANPVPLAGNFPTPPPNANPLQPGCEWIVDWLDSELYKHGNGVGPAGMVAIAAKKSWGAVITRPWCLFECNPT